MKLVAETRFVGDIQGDDQMSLHPLVPAFKNFTMTIQPGQCRAVGQIDVQIDYMAIFRQALVDRRKQRVAPRAVQGRKRNHVRLPRDPVIEGLAGVPVQQIHLVQCLDKSRILET